MNEIYFAGSIRGGREDVELYAQIVNYLGNHGTVLTEHVTDKGLTSLGEGGVTDPQIHDRDVDWLDQSKTIVAEVTNASLGVGYEIGRIVERNLWVPEESRKVILCLHRPQVDKRLSAMIAGCKGVKNVKYSELNEAFVEIDNFFRSLRH